MGITFDSVSKQPSDLVGQPLSKYEPELTDNIKGDGNCLFRCLSKITTGSKKSHLQLRSIISRFIASEGTTKLGWYFKPKQTTPCQYLNHENLIYRESIWGSDFEIIAASAILNADIYLANNDYRMQCRGGIPGAACTASAVPLFQLISKYRGLYHTMLKGNRLKPLK